MTHESPTRELSVHELLDYKVVLEARCAGRDHELLATQLELAKANRNVQSLVLVLAEKEKRITELEQVLNTPALPQP